MSKFRSGETSFIVTPGGERRANRFNIWVDDGQPHGNKQFFNAQAQQHGPTALTLALVNEKDGTPVLSESQSYILKSNFVKALNGDEFAPADLGAGAFWSGSKGTYFLHVKDDGGLSRKALEVIVFDQKTAPLVNVEKAFKAVCKAHHQETPVPAAMAAPAASASPQTPGLR